MTSVSSSFMESITARAGKKSEIEEVKAGVCMSLIILVKHYIS